MRRVASISVSLVLALLAARAEAQSASTASSSSEALAVVRRMFDGMRAGDSAMVHSAFHPQLRMLTAAKGKDGKLRLEVEESADGFLKAVGTPHAARWDERIWNERIEIDGPLASVWVDYGFYAGEKFSHCGIDHFLLVRTDDGAWKIISLADTRRTEGCTP